MNKINGSFPDFPHGTKKTCKYTIELFTKMFFNVKNKVVAKSVENTFNPRTGFSAKENDELERLAMSLRLFAHNLRAYTVHFPHLITCFLFFTILLVFKSLQVVDSSLI